MSTSVVLKLNAQKLREYSPSADELQQINRKPIYIIVENVLDTYNIGAIFRLADAVAASAVYLVGDTATPDDPLVGHKIHKSSVGTWRWMPWKYCKTGKEGIEKIQNSKFQTNQKLQIRKSGNYTWLQLSSIKKAFRIQTSHSNFLSLLLSDMRRRVSRKRRFHWQTRLSRSPCSA